MLKRTWVERLTVLSAVALTACDSPLRPGIQSEPLPVLATVIVSNPVAAAASASSTAGLMLNGTAASEVVYVSLPPGTIPDGSQATVRNLRNGSEVSVPMLDGGFDPVAVTAAAGDTLELDIQLTATDEPLRYAMVVPPTRPPIVVRTDPPPKKRDVPLNAAMMVVFSEPVAPASITPQSVQLLRGGEPVTGTVTLDTDGLRVEFQPGEALTPSTEYRLVATTAVTDLTGDALPQAMTADFTTTAEPLFHIGVILSPDLYFNRTTPVVGAPFQAASVYEDCAIDDCDTTYTGDVTLVLGAHPTGAILGGTSTVRMVDGVAAFTDLSVNVEGSYTLIATAPGAAPVTSSVFQVCAHLCWEGPRAPMPTPRAGVGVGVVGATLYAIGGVDTSFAPSAAVEAYDPATDTWTTRAPMPTARFGFGIGVVNDIVYVAGGMTASGITAAVEAYDPVTDTWSARASLPSPTGFPAAGGLDGMFYVVGGQQPESTVVATALVYDPATDQWSSGTPMPTPLSRTGLAVSDGLLYVIGGVEDYYDSIRTYDPATDRWTVSLPTNTQTGCGCWIGGPSLPAIGVLPGKGILVAAGSDGTTLLTGPYAWGVIYDPVGNQYSGRQPVPLMHEWWIGNVFFRSPTLPSGGVVNGEFYLVGYETYRFIP